MALTIRDYTFIKVAQAAHHQDDVRCGTSRSVKCSCMSLMLVTWALFICPGIWDKLDLDSILCKEDQFLNYQKKLDILGHLRYLGMEDLLQEYLVENSPLNMEFLENKTEDIVAGAYLISTSEIVNGVQQIEAGALLTTGNYSNFEKWFYISIWFS